jgi:acyl carrier protein
MSVEKLTAIFQDVLEDSNLALTKTLSAKDVGSWDSFNHINLVISIETEFAIRFTTEEIGNLQNVGDLVELLIRKGVSINW